MTFWGVDLWAAALVFARVGSILMLLPGFGEPAVPPRIRLALALLLVILLTPVLGPTLPPMPPALGPAMGHLIVETLIGLMIGAVARIIAATLSTAGQLIGLETGLAFAQTADPTMTQAGQLIAVFLSLLGVTLIFAVDLHHTFLQGLALSYSAFAPTLAPSVGDAADLAVSAVGQGFLIAVQITAPLLFAGVVFRLGLGVLSRLIPQIQVFFIAMPVNVLGGLMIMALGLSTGVLLWLDRMDTFARTFR